MSSSTSQIGSFHQCHSDSHECFRVVTETQCAQLLFQQPPSRLFLPPIPAEEQSLATDSSLPRRYWQTSPQSLYKQEQHEPLLCTEYDTFDGFGCSRNAEGSSRTPQSSHIPSARGSTAFYSDLRRDLFILSGRHSQALFGIFDQPSILMSEEYLPSPDSQEYVTPSEPLAGAPIASSSRHSSPSISKLRTSATGSYSQFSVLDTSAGGGDFAQYGASSLSGFVPGDATRRAAGDNLENDGRGDVGPVRSKKQRTAKGRERVRIALAPDQPPTTQGKQRERVFVACKQCRNRKIRCDGGKPMCYNCNQRGTGICEFDTAPKRRGPDRQPGARQRHGKVPGVRRRRPTRSDKEETPVRCQGTIPYYGTHPISEPITMQSNYQNSTWARIPSPSSSSSTNDYRYGCDQPVPGSSGSDASQAVQDYRSLLTPSFAYNAPQGYFSSSLRPGPDPRTFVSRISTDSTVDTFSAPVSSTLSPETPGSIPYSTITSPLATQATPYATEISALERDTSYAALDNLAKFNTSLSSTAVGLGDYVSRGLDLVQPVAIHQESSLPSTNTNVDTLATQQLGNPDYLAIPDACEMYPRRNSLGNVESDSYNPYQWAVLQGQDSCGAYITTSDDEDVAVPFEFAISQTPSLDFVRKTWWDSLLDSYCTEPYCTTAIAARYQLAYGFSVTVPAGMFVTGTTRQRVAQIVVHDLQSIFKDSIIWFSFFNVPLFFGTFFRARESMQPALVLALLMWANYMRSSMLDLGPEGMDRTIWLKERAQAALDASVNASWIDPCLAQAAWLIALFELSSHPARSVARLHSALGTLDNIIRALSLTFIDAQDPSISATSDAVSSPFRSSTLTNGSVSHILPMPLYNRRPIAGARLKFKYSSQLLQYHPPSRNALLPQHGGATVDSSSTHATCICNELTLGKTWPEAKDHVPFWLNSPGWKPTWSDAEIRREECRRLCWNTLHLFASYTTYRTSLGLATADLFLLHPSNVHNIFPGENLTDLLTVSPLSKLDTVWGLYARAILLWHACLRIRNVSERERAIFAQSIWLEADAIENALDGHSCSTERAFLYHGREYLFNARMYVSSEFRRFVPHPSPDMSGAVHRRKAEEWLTHQATLAKRIMHGLQALTGVRGTMLAKRPFFCFWFMGHMSRCLQLWQADKSLTVALELAKNFLSPINYLSALWPCDDQRMQYVYLRRQLENACREARLALPPPVDPSFPLQPNFNGLL